MSEPQALELQALEFLIDSGESLEAVLVAWAQRLTAMELIHGGRTGEPLLGPKTIE